MRLPPLRPATPPVNKEFIMNGYLDVVIYNVERGNAIWVSLPDGKNLMFDIGRRDDFSPLYDMWHRGVRYLDGLVITHPHTDHFNDIKSLCLYGIANIGVFLRPTHIASREIYARNRDDNLSREYIQFASSFADLIGNREFVTWDIGGAHLDIFRPHRSSTSNLNNHSLVTLISFNGIKVLIPGDCEKTGWNELLELTSFLPAVYGTKLLVAPHHGLVSGYSSDLMSEISPDICVISEGHVTDTDVCNYYASKCRGHQVSVKGGSEEMRRTVTTRNDGNVHIRISGIPYAQAYSIATFN